MWLEILLASVLGFFIYWFISGDREETLPLGDGWWGPGVKTVAREDESIRPFKVETSDEEINVSKAPSSSREGQREAGAPLWLLCDELGLDQDKGLGIALLGSFFFLPSVTGQVQVAYKRHAQLPALPLPSCSFPLPRSCSARAGSCQLDHLCASEVTENRCFPFF